MQVIQFRLPEFCLSKEILVNFGADMDAFIGKML